jgi:acetyl esterase/lipase
MLVAMTTARWMRRALGILAAAALIAVVFAAPGGAAQGGVTVKNDVTYRTVDGEQLGLDVYQSAKQGKNRPAVVVVHGGGWTQGDKALFAQQSNQLAERGSVAFSVNYRLAPAHT